ncbi:MULTISPECIES: DUF2798 domain-containing protein [unclassified Clostridium]|uniref:DUF2798 domain-containing protein n=1 Tax=unclassified Clostridium TaxID=2614128 RepID=UPI00189B53E2|nr:MULTISPECIES: DUF2798 domain-containing protein [unclassified Clostridium]MCR1949937.1 DUF2798 domain-containing protein [Clostridium sp. DSM 100503]
MPTTKLQKLFFAFLTVIITVHLFVFYNLSIEMGGMSNQVFIESRSIVWIEFIFAILLEVFIAGPLSLKLAFRAVNPREEKPYIVNTAIIFSTVCLMCPMMSFVSTLMFNGLNAEFFARWMQNIVINFPFAIFTQLFLVQPFVRFVFRLVFKNQLSMKKSDLANELA